jgi:hypothetical protein
MSPVQGTQATGTNAPILRLSLMVTESVVWGSVGVERIVGVPR